MAEPRVTCVLVNWNGWRDTVACLHALKASTYSALNIVVVDNASTNESVAEIKAAHPDVTVLVSDRNRGFAGGNNIGIRHALEHGCDYVWLLNNDTVPAPDALSALIEKAASDSRIGAVASVCYYADAPSTVQVWAGARVCLWIGYGRNTTSPHRDDWFDALYGASMLVARQAIDEVGMLDEGFFMYWEETEFCLRLRKKGWRLAAAANSRVLHKVNASTGTNSPVRDRYFTASGLRLLRLHSPMPRVSMLLFLTIRFLRRVLRFEFSRCGSIFEGVRDYNAVTPSAAKLR